MDAAIEAIWRGAGLGEFGLRPMAARDLNTIAAALALGEGYTQTGEPDTPASIRADLAGFGETEDKAGLVATEPGSDAPAAFLLYRLRNRLTEDFAAGNVLGDLPAERFPPDGRFLQVHDLWVSPALRRRGVARALKQAAEAIASARGIRMLYTVTETSHAAALRLNRGLGYVEIYRGPMWDAVPRVGLAKYL